MKTLSKDSRTLTPRCACDVGMVIRRSEECVCARVVEVRVSKKRKMREIKRI